MSATPLVPLHKPAFEPALRRSVNTALPEVPPFSSSRATFEQNPARFRLDRHGIVQTFTGATQQWEANPLNIARYTVALYDAYRHGDRTALAPMVKHARWLMSHVRTLRDAQGRHIWLLPYSFDNAAFQAPRQWVSGLAQGMASCALLLAGRAQARLDWQRMSYHLLYAFNVPVSQGGVRSQIGSAASQAAWYQEVAYSSAAASYILNGHLYATSWLGWYAKTANLSPHARQWTHQLFQEGVNGARLLLPRFNDSDTKMSVYDLLKRGRFQKYHDAHVHLLDYYYSVTGVAEFRAFASRWRGRVYPS